MPLAVQVAVDVHLKTGILEDGPGDEVVGGTGLAGGADIAHFVAAVKAASRPHEKHLSPWPEAMVLLHLSREAGTLELPVQSESNVQVGHFECSD